MHERAALRVATQRPRPANLLRRTRQHDFRRILDEQTIPLMRNPLSRLQRMRAQDRRRRHLRVREEPIGRLHFAPAAQRSGQTGVRLRPESIDNPRQPLGQPAIPQPHAGHFFRQRTFHRTDLQQGTGMGLVPDTSLCDRRQSFASTEKKSTPCPPPANSAAPPRGNFCGTIRADALGYVRRPPGQSRRRSLPVQTCSDCQLTDVPVAGFVDCERFPSPRDVRHDRRCPRNGGCHRHLARRRGGR